MHACLSPPSTPSPRKAAVKREPSMARAPTVMAPMARALGAMGAMAFPAADPQKVQKRANWLNANVFPDRPIDQEAGSKAFW